MPTLDVQKNPLLFLYSGAKTLVFWIWLLRVLQTFGMIICSTCFWNSWRMAVHFYPRWLCCTWADEPWTVHCSEAVLHHLLKYMLLCGVFKKHSTKTTFNLPKMIYFRKALKDISLIKNVSSVCCFIFTPHKQKIKKYLS